MISQQPKITVTIGVSALNEEANIQSLLKNLLLQSAANFVLSEIIVISDGSTDATADKVRELKNSKIKLIENKTRAGQLRRTNEIFALSQGELVVLIDADVLPASSTTLVNLVSPLLEDPQVAYVSGELQAIKPTTLVGRAALASRSVWDNLRLELKGGNGFYACHGGLYALRGSFAKANPYPNEIWSNVGFHYFACLKMNLKFISAKQAIVYFRLPASASDYIKQISRYGKESTALTKFFGKEIEKEYYIPNKLLFKYKLEAFFKHPILCLTIFVLNFYAKYIYKQSGASAAAWAMIKTTKEKII